MAKELDKTFLYEGKAKKIYALTDQPDKVLIEYKDDATAFDGTKKGVILSKGIVNNTMSTRLFEHLESQGIKTHFCERLGDREMITQKVDIILIEVVVRNIAAGSLCKRLGVERGAKIDPPLIEFYYKNDELHDPLIRDEHAIMLGISNEDDMAYIKKEALKINDLLVAAFAKANLTLVDYKLEFGKNGKGEIVLADEISPDTCRLWDTKTGKVLDKDRFRFDMGDVEASYKEVLERMGGRL